MQIATFIKTVKNNLGYHLLSLFFAAAANSYFYGRECVFEADWNKNKCYIIQIILWGPFSPNRRVSEMAICAQICFFSFSYLPVSVELRKQCNNYLT